MMTHDEMIEVIQAHREGKKIQFARPAFAWEDCETCTFNFEVFNYRVKPEPLVVWVNIFSNKTIAVYFSESEALNCAMGRKLKRAAVKMVEAKDHE